MALDAREPPWVVVVEVAKRLQNKQAALGKEIQLAAKDNLSKYETTYPNTTSRGRLWVRVQDLEGVRLGVEDVLVQRNEVRRGEEEVLDTGPENQHGRARETNARARHVNNWNMGGA